MPVIQIPIGVNLPVLANEVYSIPCALVFLSSGSAVGYGPTFTGPFANYTANTPIKCGFVKPSANTTIFLTRIKPKVTYGRDVFYSYSERVLQDKPSAYWTLNEASGTTAVDLIGGAHGTISGAGVTLGQPGALSGNSAIFFTGTGAQIETSVNVPVPLISTIEVWFKPTTNTSVPMVSTHLTSAPGNITFGCEVNGSLFLADDVSIHRVFPAVGVVVGQWNHLVCILDGVNATVYVNGIVKGTLSFVRPAVNTTHFYMGIWNGHLYCTGVLDEVAIYPYALSASQIKSHYDAAVSTYAGLVYWPHRRSRNLPSCPDSSSDSGSL